MFPRGLKFTPRARGDVCMVQMCDECGSDRIGNDERGYYFCMECGMVQEEELMIANGTGISFWQENPKK